ncbi:MAG: hypothetical protein V9G04_14110 [Nocardioides sp.]|jgi:hypothetical protein
MPNPFIRKSRKQEFLDHLGAVAMQAAAEVLRSHDDEAKRYGIEGIHLTLDLHEIGRD